MPLQTKNKNLIQIFFAMIVIVIVFIFLTVPNFKEIKSLSQKIFDYRVYLEKLYKEGQLLKNTIGELKKIEPNLIKLSKVLIPQKDELNFITTLEDLAANNKIEQDLKINPFMESSAKDYKILPIELYFQATFPQFIKYLADLNKLDYYINIKQLLINKSSDASKIKIALTADTYWEK